MFEKDMERLECVNTRNELIARIYDGDTLSEACGMLRLNPAAVGLTMRDDVTFDAAIREAQGFRVDIMVDKLEHINQYESDPIMASVISKNIQFVASKRLRRVYGDKVDVNHNVSINIRAAMDDARARVTLDHQPNLLIDNVDATDSTSAAPPPPAVAADEIDPLS